MRTGRSIEEVHVVEAGRQWLQGGQSAKSRDRPQACKRNEAGDAGSIKVQHVRHSTEQNSMMAAGLAEPSVYGSSGDAGRQGRISVLTDEVALRMTSVHEVGG